jgi:hypothetical protein
MGIRSVLMWIPFGVDCGIGSPLSTLIDLGQFRRLNLVRCLLSLFFYTLAVGRGVLMLFVVERALINGDWTREFHICWC